MALTTISTQTTLNNITQQIVVVDTTDYAGQGIPLDGTYTLEGRIAVYLTSASGTSIVYNNLSGVVPDITPNTDLSNAIAITLPQDSDGNIMQGSYAIIYQLTGAQPDLTPINLSVTTTYDYDFDLPSVCLTVSINCAASILTSYDETEYGAYATTVARTHTLYPPPASPMSPIVGSTSALNAGPNIYDDTWTQKVSSTVTYNFQDGLIAVLLVEGSREFGVTCDVGLGRIFCCIKKLFDRYNRLLRTNTVAAENMLADTIAPTQMYLVLYKSALDAGDSTGAAIYYAKIIEASGCGEDCGCSADGPQQIYPALASIGQFVVDSPDNSITVVPEIVGSITTFHIQVSAAIQNIINNLFSTTISTATPSYLTITQSGVGSNRNYNIDFIPSAITGASNLVDKLFIIDPSVTDAADYVEYTVQSLVNQGALINNVGVQTDRLGLTIPNVSTDVAAFLIGNILNTASTPFTAIACVMRSNDTLNLTSTKNIEAEIFWIEETGGNVYVRLYNPQTGQPYTLGDIRSGTFEKIFIKFNLIA